MSVKVGGIMCSAPSSVAVENLANRIGHITRSVAARYNGRLVTNEPCERHRLVVRGYRPSDELQALMHLLEYPDEVKMTFFSHRSSRPPLSLAWWLLTLLRSQAKCVGTLHADDKESLYKLQQGKGQSQLV
ncbi:hypothetical protein LX36DRAFT_712262 [Colletotrichum falcatum]|nr:hypothetical protein LX36DRAFT_712262 [Colletotrichum falcatum]